MPVRRGGAATTQSGEGGRGGGDERKNFFNAKIQKIFRLVNVDSVKNLDCVRISLVANLLPLA